MRFPSIHMNGTGFKTLNEEYRTAYNAVDGALKALQKVTVHGRDYYIQQGDAASEAYAEHHERLRALEKVKSELTTIILNIYDQHKGYSDSRRYDHGQHQLQQSPSQCSD